jgi:hypothetical protein
MSNAPQVPTASDGQLQTAASTPCSPAIQELAPTSTVRAEREEVQAKAFDAAVRRARQYKDDFIYQAEKPLLLDLLLFYDSLTWFQER